MAHRTLSQTTLVVGLLSISLHARAQSTLVGIPDEASSDAWALEHTSAAPVTVIQRSELEAAGIASLGEILQDLPWQSNAININFNNSGNGATRIGLRGLGSGRTLVLVNGRRHVAGGTGADASVDLNAIPLAIVERIEVIKGGDVSTYGSDAIGGVINIITRQDMSGVQAAGYYGSSADGLAPVYDTHVTAGMHGARGHMVFSLGYVRQEPLNARDREFSATDRTYDWFASQEAGHDVWHPVGSTATPDGYIVVPFFPEFSRTGELYNYQTENYVVTPQDRYHVYSAGRYELTNRTSAFFEASYVNRASEQQLAPTPLYTWSEGIVVAADNLYNPHGRPFVDVRRRLVEAGNRRHLQAIDTFRLVTGLRGTLGQDLELFRGWHWDIAYNYGRTSGLSTKLGDVIHSRVEQAVGPSFVDAAGNPRCGTIENPGDAACVPLDLFGGAGTITPEMLEYIGYTGIAKGLDRTASWTFQGGGKLFETPWGGDGRLLMGFEYRDEQGEFIPDPLARAGDTVGPAKEITSGGFNVYEAFTGLSVAPIVGKPPIEQAEFHIGARTATYSTIGNHTMWGTGGVLRFDKGVTVRGTFASAFRAPGVSALFAGRSESFPSATDPCDTTRGSRTWNEQQSCQADGLPDNFRDDRTQLSAISGGNPELQPETARTLSAGIVFQPSMLPGLSLSLDYFNIAVDSAITQKGANLILHNCYDRLPDERTDCERIARSPLTGAIMSIDATVANAGGTDTAGVDMGVRYDRMTSFGHLRNHVIATWLHKYDFIQSGGDVIAGKGVYDLGVFPAWKANLASEWRGDRYRAGVNLRYIGAFRECTENDCQLGQRDPEPVAPLVSRRVQGNITGDVYVGYTRQTELGQTQLSFGVNNVFNEQPAAIANGFHATSDAATYDFLGRYIYIRMVQQL